jgi:hypothetical protein
MASFFRNKLESGIGITPVEVISVGTNTRSTVIGLSLTNLTGAIVLASIRLDQEDSNPPNDVLSTAYYVKEVIVPPNQSLRVINGGEKLILAGNMKLYVNSNIDESLDLVMSYVDIV